MCVGYFQRRGEGGCNNFLLKRIWNILGAPKFGFYPNVTFPCLRGRIELDSPPYEADKNTTHTQEKENSSFRIHPPPLVEATGRKTEKGKRESAVHCDSLVRYLGGDHCPGGSWP